MTISPQHKQGSPDFTGAQGVVYSVDTTKLVPWMMLTCILAAFAMAFSLMTFFYLHDQMLSTQRSAELMRIQVLSQNAIMLRQGFIKPGDEWDGPEGNLQFNPNLLRKK